MNKFKEMSKQTKVIIAAVLAVVIIIAGSGVGVVAHTKYQNDLIDQQLQGLDAEYTAFNTNFKDIYKDYMPNPWPSDANYLQAVADRDDVTAYYALQEYMAAVLEAGLVQVQAKVTALRSEFEGIKQSDGYNDSEKQDIATKKQAALDLLNKEDILPPHISKITEAINTYKSAVDIANKRVAEDKKKAEEAAATTESGSSDYYNDYSDNGSYSGSDSSNSGSGSGGGGGGSTQTCWIEYVEDTVEYTLPNGDTGTSTIYRPVKVCN
ncbi:hypothetical protein [Culicoidibacter larvae]|uniref:Uncharacterized protein n=1 Tax=Culicoidibacter larvae TaxID=2579976 RepID=A0A5R8Q6V6_9FIRM|nr:hypothetical protein [Culicoidibacter larvae]TLG71152.1 hypothetical protein FEZ08_11400 [Culicoidibacter larvae]